MERDYYASIFLRVTEDNQHCDDMMVGDGVLEEEEEVEEAAAKSEIEKWKRTNSRRRASFVLSGNGKWYGNTLSNIAGLRKTPVYDLTATP
ncbi:hypothetical protein M0804_011645 [Polistes exclamans]|nr:hypothetical protein M0804_011645 [Polistes exclamans]